MRARAALVPKLPFLVMRLAPLGIRRLSRVLHVAFVHCTGWVGISLTMMELEADVIFEDDVLFCFLISEI